MSGPQVPSGSGLTAVEVALLRVVQECTAVADGPYAPSAEVLDQLDARAGLGPRYADRLMGDLTVGWVRHLPLLEGDGNFGSMAGDEGAAAQYTRVRLSGVGELALASERGTIGPLPLDLIEGSLYRGGGLPPFDPALTIRALLAGSDDAGLPRTPTGTIRTDPTGLFRRDGRWVQRYQLGSVIRTGPGAHQLVLTEPPYLIGTDRILASLRDRLEQAVLLQARSARAHYLPSGSPSIVPPESVPIRDALTSGRTGTQIILHLRTDVDIIDAVDWVRSIWPVTVYAACASYEEIYDRFAPWHDADQSGVRALDDLLHTIKPTQD